MEKLTDEQNSILIGLLLGDGHLAIPKNGKNPCLQINRSLVDESYNIWLAEKFKDYLTPKSIARREFYDKRTNKIYYRSTLRTKCSPIFLPYWKNWYNSDTKHIPTDLSLDAITIAIWFADDGSVVHHGTHALDLKLSTHGFKEKEVIFLKTLLEERYNSSFRIYCELGYQYHIRGFTEAAKALLKNIDDVFPPLERKSSLWRADNYKLLKDKNYPPCIFCYSTYVYANGHTKDGIQKFHCQNCKKQFSNIHVRNVADVQRLRQKNEGI